MSRMRIRGQFLVALLGAGCSQPDTRPNVVVVVLDTARPDYMSAYGHPRPTTPFLERFAAQGTRFDRAYSVSCWTLPAHVSLFTGEPPNVHKAQQLDARVNAALPLLAEDLRAAGYQTAGFSNNVWISTRNGLARGFDHFVDRWQRRARRADAPEEDPTVADLREWLARRDAERPAFVFVNLIQPHMPYWPPWEAAEPFLESRADWESAVEGLFPPSKPPALTTVRHYAGRQPLDAGEWRQMRGLYEGDLRVCDEVTRAIVAAVDASLDPTNTLVFLLSDHGENLGDHEHVSHIFNLYESNLRIALLARGPGFAPGAHESRLVQITDLHPTIRRAAGLVPHAGSAAIDLRGPLPGERLLYAELDYPHITLTSFPDAMRADGGPLDRHKRSLVAAVGTRWKMIRGSDGSLEVYDLLADPNETRPVPAPRIEAHTGAALEAFLEISAAAGASAGPGTPHMPTDPATLDALRALGYTQ